MFMVRPSVLKNGGHLAKHLKTPEVTLAILIPAYNCRDTISETLASLQAIKTGWDRIEKVVVCDDASTDDTIDVINAVHFDRCRLELLRHDINRGEGHSYTTMVAALSPSVEWFLILHSDDLALDNFVDRNLELANRCGPRVAAVSSAYYEFDQHGEKLSYSQPEDLVVWRGDAHDDLMHTAVVGTWWHISGSLVNRAAWEHYGGRDPALPQLGDWDLMLRWQRDGHMVGHSLIPTTKYRVTAKSVSSKSYLEFRDIAERAAVILRHPDIFTPAMRRRIGLWLGLQAGRRIVKLIAHGKVRAAATGSEKTMVALADLVLRGDL